MIRLTLLLAVSLFGAMLVFGKDDPSLQSAVIRQEVLPAQEPIVVRKVVTAPVEAPVTREVPRVTDPRPVPVVQQEPRREVEVTQLDTLDLNTIAPNEDPVETETAALDTPATTSEVSSVVSVEPQADRSTLLFVTGSRVNLRAGPSTGQAVVMQLSLGDKAELLTNTPDGWVQIRHLDSGNIGYMSADFLSPDEQG